MYEFIIGVLLINNQQRVCVLALVYFTAVSFWFEN